MNATRFFLLTSIATAILAISTRFTTAAEKIPIIHSTDLLHPYDDPDDHYDLATLFALKEFDIKGIILDLGERQVKRPGTPPVNQMMHITGRKCPFAIGLDQPLKNRTDKVLEADAKFQGGIELMLSILRKSPEKVVIHTAGSCRDTAAALNREPALFKEKVRAIYMNIGNGLNDPQNEYNVGLDIQGYLRLFESGVPVYWCPCFGKDGYATVYRVEFETIIDACKPQLRNYFIYCLTKSQEDPIEFLLGGQHSTPKGPWNFYCTGPMFHIAGRKIYERGSDDFVALPPDEAKSLGLSKRVVKAFDFVPMLAKVEPDGMANGTIPEPEPDRLAAVYLGRPEDRVGTDRAEPDGIPDCCIRIVGAEPKEPIKNIVLTGPNNGRWELSETGRWWRLAYERNERRIDCYFHFFAVGEHEAEIMYENGKTQSVRFTVPAALTVSVDSPQHNGFVFRATNPKYSPIMASCIKNLLATLPEQPAEK